MKRTNVVLDEAVLEKAVELSGERTYSSVINRALNDLVRKLTVERGIEELADPNTWWPGYAEELYGAEWVRETRKKLRKKGLLKGDRPTVAEMKKTLPRNRRDPR
jgi:hypothetical protein